MDSRQRVRTAISRQPVDRLPCGEILIEDAVVHSYLGCNHVAFEERRSLVERLGLDLVCLPTLFAEKPPKGVPSGPGAACWPELHRWVLETDLFVFVMLDGPFGWGTRLMGWTEFFCALARRSHQVAELIAAVENLNLQLAREAISRGAMGVLIADDIAHGRGLTIPPAMLRQFFFPSFARQIACIHDRGAPVFFHSDGGIHTVVEDLVQAGFDGLQCIEAASGMDLRETSARYGERLCLWGNLDLRELMLPRTPGQLRAAVDEVVSAGGSRGGLIFGTSSGLAGGVRNENLTEVYRLARHLSSNGLQEP